MMEGDGVPSTREDPLNGNSRACVEFGASVMSVGMNIINYFPGMHKMS